MSGERPKGEQEKKAFYRALPETELVRLLRQRDYEALLEFTTRYAPLLLNYIERQGFDVPDADTVATDLLSDIAASFIGGQKLPSCTMETYVVRSFSNRLASLHRQSLRRGPKDEASESVQEAGCSEGTVSLSAGLEYERSTLSPALDRLSAMLEEGLSSEERDLLGAVSEYASQREIATWMGMSHDAVRKQLERLRRRLRLVARRYVNALNEKERSEIRRFFARVDAVIEPNDSGSHDPPKAAGQ